MGEPKRTLIGNGFAGTIEHTVDIKTILPDDYRNLHIDNFGIIPTTIICNVFNEISHATQSKNPTMTYNSSTGILKLSAMYVTHSGTTASGGISSYSVYCWH